MELIVTPGGVVKCIYDEAVDLGALGAVEIRRASHVEPDAAGAWWADLSPVGGPRLGPFPRRSAALEAEFNWLVRYVLHDNRDRSCHAATGTAGSQHH